MGKSNIISVVWKEDKYFVSQCLNVDVSSFGKTKKEAQKHLEEALILYFDDPKQVKIEKVEKPEIFSLQMVHA